MTELLIFVAGGVVVAYPIMHASIMRVTEPVRMELADLGKQMLVSPDISELHKQFISDMLDDVFSWKFMAMATFTFPSMIFSKRRRQGLTEDDRKFVARSDMTRFFDLHMKAVMAASPAWSVLFMIVALATIAILIVVFGFSFVSQTWIDTVKQISPNIHNSGIHIRRATGH